MTSPNSLFDGRSIDPGNQPQSSVTKQARRKQKVDSKLGQSEHKLASNNVLNPQDLKLRCLRCKKRKLNCEGGGPAFGDCNHCSSRALGCVWPGAEDVSTPRFRKVYSSDEVEGSIPGSGVGKINSTELAAYTLSRYLLSKMDNSASRPPNSISSRENHAKLNKTSQMDQPRLSHNLPIAYNDSGDSMPSGFMPSSRSPFAHPGGQDATLAISMSPERATFPAIAEIINRPPSLPGRSLSPENPERPCERWLREQREARPATPSATPFPSSPSAQRRHSQSCFSASSAKGLGCKPDQLVNQSSNSGAVKELRDRVKRQWQEGRSEPPKPAYLSQAPPPDAGGPYTVSVSRNPFYDLASRTSTPSPFRQAAEITSWIKGESENVPGRSNLNLSIGSEQPCRSSAMSRSSSNEGQLGLIERAKDKAKHEKDLQAFSGELLSWPQTMSNKLETSSDGVLTPCASSNTSGSSGDCVTPPESEPISKGEELYDGSEESCSSTVDQTCDTVGKSVAEKQHGAAKQSTREFSFTHHTSDILRSCPANGGSSSSRSASDALPSVAPGRPSTGTVHRQKPKGRQLPTDEYGEADSDEDGDEENKRQQGTTGDPFVTRDKGRLACPYHARSPSKHYKYTSCYARGFSTVHRVKEHIYRRHVLRPVCPRCWKFFNDIAALNNHLNATKRCERKTRPSLWDEGFNEQQEKELKKRPKIPGRTEEEKWNVMYRILFPDDDENDLPGPHRGTDAPFDRQLKQLLLKEIKTIIEQHYGPIDAEIRMKIDGIPARAVAEARRLYHTPPPDTETSGDPSEDGTTTNVSLPPAEERTFNGDSSMPIIATRRSSTTPYWPPSAIHGEPSTVRQYRPTATDTIQDVFVNRQGRVGSQQTVHPHHTSTTTNTSHAQLQQAQPILGQSQEEYNLHPAQALSPEAQLPQNYFMQPPFTSGHSHRSAAAMMNSMQPGSWDNISAQQAESAFPSWPSGSTPFPRPETTPPIASMSHHPALPSMNAQYWTSPPSPMPLGDWSGNLGFPVAPNMRRNSYANPPPTQRYFASPQTTPNFSQPMIPDQNLFSVREQNQDFFTDQHQFNTVQARPYLSARGRNPFGPFPSIHEEIVEQTDEPDYEGVGQNMDRSP